MPQTAKSRSKRPLSDADPNASPETPKAKRISLEKRSGTDQGPASEESRNGFWKGQSNEQADRDGSRRKNAKMDDKDGGSYAGKEKIRASWEIPTEADEALRGPDGNLQTPDALPLEAEAAADAYLVSAAATLLDGTPGRILTLGNDRWRLENYAWLKKHASKLNGHKYLWTDLPDKGEATESQTGSRTGTKILVNYSAVASDAEKRAIKEIDKELRMSDKPDESERLRKMIEREDKAKKPTDWICIRRPGWDNDEEIEEAEVETGTEDEPPRHQDGNEIDNDKEGTLADDFPEYRWISTKRGRQWFKYWVSEQAKRDQDIFDMYMYNDWTGYGIREVLENQIQCFKVQFMKKVPNIVTLWFQFEAMALFLSCDWMPLWMIDDSEGLAELVQLQGRLVVSFFRFLIQLDLFKNDSPIRNIGLVAALWIRYFKTQTHPDLEPSPRRWCPEIVRLADEHSLEMYGPSNIAELCEEIREDRIDEEEDSSGSAEQDSDDEGPISVPRREDVASRRWGFVRHFTLYAENYARESARGKIGGGVYDITKMSKLERSRRTSMW